MQSPTAPEQLDRSGRPIRPAPAPEAARPETEPQQAAIAPGPDGRKSAAKQKLSKRGKGSEEPPKGDAVKDEPARSEGAKDDAPKSETPGEGPKKLPRKLRRKLRRKVRRKVRKEARGKPKETAKERRAPHPPEETKPDSNRTDPTGLSRRRTA